jgi:hypothetical protein
MRTLSATECISPAIERTKLVLFTPFRKGRSWKLSATAYLALCGQMFAPFPLLYLIYLPQVRRFGTWAVYALAGGVVATTVLYLVVFYLCSTAGSLWLRRGGSMGTRRSRGRPSSSSSAASSLSLRRLPWSRTSGTS